MKRLIIVKTGGKIASLADVPGDYEDWIASGMKGEKFALETIDIQRGGTLPALSGVCAIVITGSASMVTERTGWMELAAAWLREAVAWKIPLLGICFGHQLLAYALGGDVGYNPQGLEVGTATIRLCDEAQNDRLFKGLPGVFAAQVSHRQSVLRLPKGARILAMSDKDPHQAFAYGKFTWGIQFHPEFDARIVRGFIEHFRQRLEEEGDSAERLLAEVTDSPHSASLLPRFALLVAGNGKN